MWYTGFDELQPASKWRRIESALGTPIPEPIRRQCEKLGYVEDISLDPEGTLSSLRTQVTKLMKRRPTKRTNISDAPVRRQCRDKGLALRARAMAALLALEARGDKRLIQFRSAFLGDALVEPEELREWLSTHAGEPNQRRTLLMVQFLGPTGRAGFVQGNSAIFTELDRLAEYLAGEYDWTKAQAVTFALTDQPQVYRPVRPTVTLKLHRPTMSRITLEIGLSTSPTEVAEIYAKIRRELLGTASRMRPIASAACEKILVLEKHRGDEELAFREWRRRHPGSYPAGPTGLRTFKGHLKRHIDCLLAGKIANQKGSGLRDQAFEIAPVLGETLSRLVDER